MHSGQEIRQIDPMQGYVGSLAFARDGRTLASGGADSTILLWDLTGRANAKAETLTAKQLDALWADLCADAEKADRAIWVLALAPEQRVAALKERLRPGAPVEAQKLVKLLANLESVTFKVRQQAEQTLIEMAEAVEPALRQHLLSNPLEVRRHVEQILEKRAREALRRLRAIDALEQIDAPEALQVLQTLAQGAANPRVRQASEAALQRRGRP
jgi:hypothetical protein